MSDYGDQFLASLHQIRVLNATDIEFDEVWAEEAIGTVKRVMQTLDDSVIEGHPIVMTPSGTPFCGCDDCADRETLYVMTILVAQGVARGRVRLPLT